MELKFFLRTFFFLIFYKSKKFTRIYFGISNKSRIIKLYREIRESLTKDVSVLKEKLPDFAPGLAIVQVGAREDSNVYIKMKINAAREVGIDVQRYQLPNTTTEIELINKVNKLNNDSKVHGIIVQMPLDSINKINSHLITDLVSPVKDVDG